MTQRVYRSAQGKMVDLGALMLKNENVRAVSNQNVNARGDYIDSMNHPISPKNEQVNRSYRQNNLNSDPVTVSKPDQSKEND